MSSTSRYPEYQVHTEANMKSAALWMPGGRQDGVGAQAGCWVPGAPTPPAFLHGASKQDARKRKRSRVGSAGRRGPRAAGGASAARPAPPTPGVGGGQEQVTGKRPDRVRGHTCFHVCCWLGLRVSSEADVNYPSSDLVSPHARQPLWAPKPKAQALVTISPDSAPGSV